MPLADPRAAQAGQFETHGALPHVLRMWGLLALMILLVSASRILEWRFPDPDDIMRLVEVRDLLGGQGWFDLDQYRIDPLREVPMHWSRLVDLPLAIIIGGLTPIIGQGLLAGLRNRFQ